MGLHGSIYCFRAGAWNCEAAVGPGVLGLEGSRNCPNDSLLSSSCTAPGSSSVWSASAASPSVPFSSSSARALAAASDAAVASAVFAWFAMAPRSPLLSDATIFPRPLPSLPMSARRPLLPPPTISSSSMRSPFLMRSSCAFAFPCPCLAAWFNNPMALNGSLLAQRMALWYCASLCPASMDASTRASPLVLSFGTPRPSMYILPSWKNAFALPVSALNAYLSAAADSFFLKPPMPFSCISPISAHASAMLLFDAAM
mmetsp:Transcript_69565/g.140008  ORF Transcript_69565/g.140008 Transcript_69565/m.140008 type:complete len:257 (-) Transcript_69565:683-1453(-)